MCNTNTANHTGAGAEDRRVVRFSSIHICEVHARYLRMHASIHLIPHPHIHTPHPPLLSMTALSSLHHFPSSALASTPQRQHQVQRRSTLKLVVLSRLVIRPMRSLVSLILFVFPPPSLKANRRLHSHLLASEDQTLLRRRDTLLFLHALLYPGYLYGVSVFLSLLLL